MAHLLYFLSISILSSTVLFLYGFFPILSTTNAVKSDNESLPRKLNSHNTNLPSIDLDTKELYKKHVEKLVFVVIDGLRYDFVSKDNMKYTMSRIEETDCIIKIEVNSPTVTMPRLKSLMTGSISKYIDVILNFGATQISSDSLIHQLNQANSRIVFYGDDTWLKLFPPDIFERHEGTSSFYVSDYTEVDNNVTRNVVHELKHLQSWDVMILHYLGLDHIGHIENSYTPLIHTKLNEMDSIIEMIHKTLIENEVKSGESFLLAVTGDHGMRDMGGHGGSTKSETLVPLVTLGNDCKHRHIDTMRNMGTQRRVSLNDKVNKLNIVHGSTASQVDVTPTLAVLLGIPIPLCNTGQIIPKILQNIKLSQLLYAYNYNTKQIADTYFGGSQQPGQANQIFSEYYNLLLNELPSELQVLTAIESYSELLSKMSSQIKRSSTHVDSYLVLFSIILSVGGTIIAFLEPNLTLFSPCVFCIACIIVYINSFPKELILLNIFISYLLSIQLNALYELCQAKLKQFLSNNLTPRSSQGDQHMFNLSKIEATKLHKTNTTAYHLLQNRDNAMLILLTGMTILSSLSTSFIENEHNVWMYVLNTFFLYILLHSKLKSERCVVTALLILHRFLRSINMKWLDQEVSVSCTLSYWFQMSNLLYLKLFSFLSMISVYLVCLLIENNCDEVYVETEENGVSSIPWNKVSSVLITTSMIGSYLYRSVPYNTEYTLFLSISSLVFYLVSKLLQTTFSRRESRLKLPLVSTILFSVLLFKPYNTILISSLCVTSYFISNVLFPNNSVASILLHLWLGHAYYFLQGSTNSIATIDITVGYIGQSEYNSFIAGILIYFNMYALNFLTLFLLFRYTNSQKYSDILKIHYKFISLNVTLYLFIIYLQRYHLFIWSVFSPKLLLLSSCNIGNIFILILLYLFVEQK